MSDNQTTETPNQPTETAAETQGAVATKEAAAKLEPNQEKPAAELAAAAPSPAKEEPPKEAPKEAPFTTDVLQNCTSRFTRKAWDIYLDYQKDMTLIRTKPVRATLTARTANGAEEIQKLLSEAGVQEMSRADKTLSFTATFEQIQAVIKYPETHHFDAVKI